MAAVKGIKEKVHLPLYDSVSVKPEKQLSEILSSNVLRFFLDVTGKTKLLTNMQASSLLPHWNTYEARAMRVVISDLPPQLPDIGIEKQFRLQVVDRDGKPLFDNDKKLRMAQVENFKLTHFVEFKRRIEMKHGEPLRLSKNELEGLDLKIGGSINDDFAEITRQVLRQLAEEFVNKFGKLVVPANAQSLRHDGFGGVIGKFIYNTVTTFFVGEKIMIQVPTWFFPAGAGPYSEDGMVTTHGYPNPEATFRFAEPVMIDAQQNFRVEIEVPESEVLSDLQRLYGPLFIWVILDGYMTRDVQ